MSWLERWLRRRDDIAREADSDLFADNAQRWWWGAVLILAGILLVWIGNKWPLPHAAHTVLNVIAALLAVAGLVLMRWARAMDRFLRNPDPEGPPSITKE